MPHNAIIVTDLGFGDAGKGTITDTLARRQGVASVVRYNGGGQAAHNVVTDDGRHHTFSQFGSGTFVPGVATHLSHFALFDPLTLLEEAARLEKAGCGDALERFSVDAHALMVSPFQKAANCLRELSRGKDRHGSCGMGIGETMADRLAQPDAAAYARDLLQPKELADKFSRIRDAKRREILPLIADLPRTKKLDDLEWVLDDPSLPGYFAERYAEAARKFRVVDSSSVQRLLQGGDLVFEGAQGVLLDEWYGFHPYTTWSTTRSENALALLREAEHKGTTERIGVLRAYHTRHGAGPFVTEDADLTERLGEPHNGTHPWQGAFRVGWLDLVAARYALAANGGADALAITHLDRFGAIDDRKVCVAYRLEDGTVLTELPLKRELEDLSHQAMLTELLMAATPVYEAAPRDNDTYLEMIERELSVPVTITSHGPTAADKRTRERACREAA